MTALWITLAAIGGLLLLCLLILLFSTVKLRLVYGEKLKIVASVLGIRFTLFSDKSESEPTKDLSRCRSPERALRKELKKQEKARRKAELKAKKKAAKKANNKQPQKAKPQPSPNLKENLEMITAIVKAFYEKTNGRVNIRVHKLHVSVGSDDAAKTAIMYGMILQGVVGLLQWIQDQFAPIKRKPGAIAIQANYLSESISVKADVVCYMSTFRALLVGIGMLSVYQTEKAIAVKKAKRRLSKKNAA